MSTSPARQNSIKTCSPPRSFGTDDQAVAARTDTTLSEVMRGEHPGRRFHDEITRDSPIRLSLQDCVIAWHAFRKARARGIGARIDLER